MSAPWTTAVLALAALPAGIAAGWLHFSSLGRVADLLVAGRFRAIALQLLRLVLLAGFLVLCALAGGAVLIAAGVGILLGRAAALRRAR